MSAESVAESIPAGYKQTEVGVIPEDWEVKRLEKVADILSGGTPSTTQSLFWDGNLLWCTPTDITALKSRKYLIETNRKITIQGLQSSSSEMIPANSLIMTSRATIGECAINLIPVCTNQGFKNFVPLDDIDVEFLYYLVQTKKQDLISLCGGSTFLEIGKTQLANFKVQLPPTLAEQQSIATALSDTDALIESLEQLIAKKRQIKQGAMQELLTGKRRLPDFQVKLGYKQTEVGVIPEDWNLICVGDISITVASGTSQVDFNFGDYPVYGSTGIIGQCIKGDYAGRAILIARVGANAGKLNLVDGKYGVTDNTIIVRINDSYNLDYFRRQLEAKNLNSMIFGSGQPLITGTQIKNIKLPFPPTKTEQNAIATILSDMDAEITSLEEKLGKTRQIKQGMMQELLTGRIRLV